ncbi:stage III sporulation protein AG [Metabacillus fastidiosus]
MSKQSFFQKMKQLLQKSDSKKQGKYQYFVIVLVLGIAFMLISNLFSKQPGEDAALPVANPVENENTEVFKQTKNEEKGSTIKDFENEYENQLKEVLETVAGIDDVSVIVNVDATSMKVLEKNSVSQNQVTEETDREGGTRKVEDKSNDEQVVIIRNGEQETPLVLQTKKPEIRGVLIVAKGADNIHIKQTIVEAVTRALGVPSHRVAVAPKK